MRVGSLCSGIGGLDAAVCAMFDGDLVFVSEIDPGASAVLAHRFPGVPNLGDFTTQTLPDVDVLCAGFPCQPVSQAGKRAGTDDDRWLFDDILDAVGRMGSRPGVLVFENVPGLLSANGGDAMARVVQGLAQVGYVGSYGVLGSADVGGCHRRDRVWIVAAADAGSLSGVAAGRRAVLGRREDDAQQVGVGGGDTDLSLLPTPAVNDMGEGKTVEWWDEWTAKMRAAHGNGNGHGNSLAIEAQRIDGTFGAYSEAVARWATVHGPPPAPTVDIKGKPRLSPDFCEWMMGYPHGWTDVPGVSRTARLKCVGNSVQPQTAAAALPQLVSRLAA